MVTLKDVAEKCGVSVSTVSRAMNGVELINADRAEEIRAAAREMGYAPIPPERVGPVIVPVL